MKTIRAILKLSLAVLLVFSFTEDNAQVNKQSPMQSQAIIRIEPLNFLWPVSDPFLFCAHHRDEYPAGNYSLGPSVSLEGRDIGEDFTLKDGFRMYHGDSVPGFPAHPHRGFETVTIVQTGMVDHSDSHGQAGRYGGGDVQWMTAGSGLQHSEMFPLLNADGENHLELFQVWLNLPKSRKMADPHFKMLWSENIPKHKVKDAAGKTTIITIIAGEVDGIRALPPAPDSWAAEAVNEVAIWTVSMEPGAEWTLPPASPGLFRCLYFYRGASLMAGTEKVKSYQAASLRSEMALKLVNGENEGYFLLLQGKPILEPVAKYGPFVMNTQEEIQQAFSDYRKTEFGGWPWPRYDMVHPREKGRFARHIDGMEEVR